MKLLSKKTVEMECEYSSAGRARPCQGRGHEFEPRYSLQFKIDFVLPESMESYRILRNASIAQLVERDLAKVEVTSSNLVTRSNFQIKFP